MAGHSFKCLTFCQTGLLRRIDFPMQEFFLPTFQVSFNVNSFFCLGFGQLGFPSDNSCINKVLVFKSSGRSDRD